MEKIQELTDKLYREGVEKGNAEGMRLVEKAKAEKRRMKSWIRRVSRLRSWMPIRNQN